MDDKEVWLRIYQENFAHARSHQAVRAQTASIIVAISIGVVTLVGVGGNILSLERLPAELFVPLLGFFGGSFSQVYHERIYRYLATADGYRDKVLPKLEKGEQTVEEVAARKVGALSPFKLHDHWVLLHYIVGSLGAILAVTNAIYNLWPLFGHH
jgi:hypothetical protein